MRKITRVLLEKEYSQRMVAEQRAIVKKAIVGGEDLRKVLELDQLLLRCIQCSRGTISLHHSQGHPVTTKAKHMLMIVEVYRHFDRLQPFPWFELVEFFSNHLKLLMFEIYDAIFTALYRIWIQSS